jgi:tetratricopeptide (TPR) repeat protein
MRGGPARIVRAFGLAAILTLGLFQPAFPQARDQQLPPALAERFAEGVDALKAGRAAEAEAVFRDVLLKGGNRAPVHHNLGIVLQQQGRQVDALAHFRAAARLDPSFGPARLLAGTSLLALARPQEARSELDQAVRLMPREVVAHVQLADACRRLEDDLCVADAYSQVVRLAPEDPEYAYRLGTAYLRLSQWAHEHLSRIDPDSARVHQALGREYLRQGRPDLALRALLQAAEADPRLPEVHLALARIHFDEGRLDDAAREVASELDLVPSSKDALALKVKIDAARRAPPD